MLWMYKCNQYTTLAEKSTLDREIYRYLYTKNLYCCLRIIIVITILSKFLNILSNSSKNCKLLVSKEPMSYSRICTKMANVFGSEKDNVALIKCKKNELRQRYVTIVKHGFIITLLSTIGSPLSPKVQPMQYNDMQLKVENITFRRLSGFLSTYIGLLLIKK